jgi:hypothetical protein
MLRSAQRACPRLELGARLEARATSLQSCFRWVQSILPTASFARGDGPAVARAAEAV